MTRFHFNLALVVMALVLWIATPAPANPPAAAAPSHYTGTVVNSDGKPATDATITLSIVDDKTRVLVSAQSTNTDKSGSFEVSPQVPPCPAGDYYLLSLSAKSPEGIGFGNPSSTGTTIRLDPFTTVRIQLLDGEGSPVQNVRILPGYIFKDESGASLSAAAEPEWAPTTDSSGYVTLSGLPQGSTLQFDVDDNLYASPDNNGQIQLSDAPISPNQTFHITKAGTISGSVVFGTTGKPAEGVDVWATSLNGGRQAGGATTDSTGNYTIDRIPAGSYVIKIGGYGDSSIAENWTAAEPTVVVTESGNYTGVDVKLIRGVVIAGVVRDIVTGNPMPGVQVDVRDSSGTFAFARTGDNGQFRLRVPPGADTVFAYAGNSGVNNNPPVNFDLADGGLRSLDIRIPAPPVPTPLSGIVRGPDGTPIAGAEVLALDASDVPHKTTSDSAGNFSFGKGGVTGKTVVFARSGDLATAPVPAPAGKSVTLSLSPGLLCSFNGRIVGDDGKPVSGATVTLVQWRPDNSSGAWVGTASTDSEGRYSFADNYGGLKYSTYVRTLGYGSKYGTEILSTPGKPLVFQDLVLSKADSFVAGTIVDAAGKPVAGAVVSNELDQDTTSTSDNLGHFRISGMVSGNSILAVQAPDNRQASVQVPTGTDANVIKVMNMEEEQAESIRFEAMVKADPSNHGDGEDAAKLLKAAEARAAAGGKQVLLVFHASWCGPCFMLHHYLEDPQVKPIIDKHFVVQDIDIWERTKNGWENPGGTKIYTKYGGPNSVPYFVVLDPTGKKLGSSMYKGQNMGMPSEPDMVSFFLKTLKTASPSLNASEQSILQAGITRDDSL